MTHPWEQLERAVEYDRAKRRERNARWRRRALRLLVAFPLTIAAAATVLDEALRKRREENEVWGELDEDRLCADAGGGR